MLVSSVEPRTFENDVSSDFEKPIEFRYDRIVYFALVLSDIRRRQDGFCLFSDAVQTVLICCAAAEPANPDATRNCSKRRFHLGQSSGVRKLNGSGGSSRS